MARLWLNDFKQNHVREGLYCDLQFGQASVFRRWFEVKTSSIVVTDDSIK